MGNAIKYYLVARDRNTNEFEIIRINGKRFSSLEEIDLYTMDYNNSKDLSTSLNKTGDIDYYIVFQQKRGNEPSLKTYEVIYSNNTSLNTIAANSKNKKIKDSENEINELLKHFCYKMTNQEYYRLVLDGNTDIYNKLTKHFFFNKYHTLADLKRTEGSWLIKSYPLVRNIVESMTNNHWRNQPISDKMYRGLIKNRVLEQADSKYDENQISLFDLFPTERKDDTSDIFNIMHIIDNIPNEIIQDNDFMQTFPEEIREDVIRLKKNRLFNDNTSSNYSNSRYKKIEQLQNNIIKSLGNENIKSKVLIWCNIYNDNNKVSGDVNGYSYKKRNQ